MIELTIILLLTVLNGVFSMSETAVVSARRALLQQRAESGDAGAKAALALVQQPDRFLSTVQIFITLIGIIAGAFGGSGLTTTFAALLVRTGVPTNIANPLGLVGVVSLITYLSLVIGELVPKTLALGNAENIASAIARPMNFLSKATAPLVSLLSLSTRAVLAVFRIKERGEQTVSEDEIRILIDQATDAGVFEEEEQAIVERVFRLGDRRANALMTPRREIVFLDAEHDWAANREIIRQSRHSAFPVCQGGLDNILGILDLRESWDELAASDLTKPLDFKPLLHPAAYLLESKRALLILDVFRENRTHLSLVVDEYGNVVGALTLHDVLEAVMGEVPRAGDTADLPALQRADGSWLFDGMLPADDMLRLLEIKTPPDDFAEYATAGGFVMARLGNIPTVGALFDWEGCRFEVVDMDGHRVDRLLVRPAA